MQRRLFTALLLLVMAAPCWSQSPDYELSYLLVRTSDGATLASLGEEKLRTPASSLKVVTAAAALEKLGPEHRYHTSLVTAGEVRRGRLHGDLVLRGDADPELNGGSLHELAREIWRSGIRRIEGDLIVDGGRVADPPYGAGWAWDDAGASYSPEITGLAVDHGVAPLRALSPDAWIHRDGLEENAVELIPGRGGVVVKGELPESLAPPNSALRTGAYLREHLRSFGVVVTGDVKAGHATGDTIADHPSRPLRLILEEALKVSDNLAMELVGRSNGAALPRVLEGERLRVVDGSGLSRYNLLSARQLVNVLADHPDLKPLLPTGGEGTLMNRFTSGAVAGHIRAKTGTVSNVSALVGYLYPDTDRECVFAILINGSVDTSSVRKGIENVLVETWAREVGSGALVPEKSR